MSNVKITPHSENADYAHVTNHKLNVQ